MKDDHSPLGCVMEPSLKDYQYQQPANYGSINVVAVLALVTVICLAPFADKAFHIDDPLFIWTAKRINSTPTDFYGFPVNWYGYEAPMWETQKNPPLVSYIIAVAALFVGWSEVALHLTFLIPAVAFILGTWYLARSFCGQPHLAALVTLFTPAFLVSGTNIMSDTLMGAFYVWAAALWVRGLETDRFSYFLFAGIFAALSGLTKYFGMTLVLLLLFYTLAQKRRLGEEVLFLLIPIGALVLYEGLTYRMYGSGLILSAAAYPISRGAIEVVPSLTKILTALAFTGGCLASAAFFAPLIWSRRGLTLALALPVILAALLLSVGAVGPLPLGDSSGIRWGLVLQLALFVAAGIHILVLAVLDVRRHQTAAGWLLFLWVAGTFLFAGYVTWATSARTILPMAPAVAILVVRRLEQRAKEEGWQRLRHMAVIALVPAAFIALAVTWADFTWANCQRTAVQACKAKLVGHPGKVWFQGHWGFQYYMESIRAQALDFAHSDIGPRDIVVMPVNNCSLRPMPEDRFRMVGYLQFRANRRLATQQWDLGAAFYSSEAGPMPFVAGPIQPETYLFYQLSSLVDADR